jgi:periplasmic divalent cation tolerance protein
MDCIPVEMLVTYPSKELALAAGEAAVKLQMAACAQVSGEITSIYRWEGAVQRSTEYQLRLKTTSSIQQKLVEWLLKNHPYQVPEIVAVQIACVTPDYLRWIRDSTRQEDKA